MINYDVRKLKELLKKFTILPPLFPVLRKQFYRSENKKRMVSLDTLIPTQCNIEVLKK